jgi:thioredoxin 1
MSANTVEITDANFNAEVAQASQPVLVDFWAEWCGPCKALAPTLELVAQDFKGRAKVGKVNVDQNPGLATRFNIKGIPTLLIFKDGMVKDQLMGGGPNAKEMLARMIEKQL